MALLFSIKDNYDKLEKELILYDRFNNLLDKGLEREYNEKSIYNFNLPYSLHNIIFS